MVLNASVKEALNLSFISDWIKVYHRDVRNYYVYLTEWERDGKDRMSREVFYERPHSIILGHQETEVQEKQCISYTELEGVVIEVEGRSLDVPYSDFFVEQSLLEIPPSNAGRDTA